MTPFQVVGTLFLALYLIAFFRLTSAVEHWSGITKKRPTAPPKTVGNPYSVNGQWQKYDSQKSGREWLERAKAARAEVHKRWDDKIPKRQVAPTEFVAAKIRREAGVGIPTQETPNETATPSS